MSTLVKDATDHGVAWTLPQRMINDGGGSAWTATLNTAEEYFAVDAASLPASMTLDGITIKLDAFKQEPSGSGTLRLGVQLSWDNGSTWTTEKATSNLTLTEAEYSLGGAADDWGHTPWTRAQLQSGQFRMKVWSREVTAFPVVEYHCDHIEVTFHYTDTTSHTYAHTETLRITETTVASTLVYKHVERLNVRDAGSSQEPITQHLTLGGTAITDAQSDPLTPWQEACESNKRRESFGAIVNLSSSGPTFGLGDANAAQQFVGIQAIMGWALLDMSDIDRSGNYGEAQKLEACILSVRVGELSDLNTADQKPMAEWLQSKSAIGQNVVVYNFVDGGNGWQQRIVFDGVIDFVELIGDRLDINCVFIGKGNLKVPDTFVDIDSFDYEDTFPDTGLQIEASEGKAVPIGFGRFDLSAVAPDIGLSAGHPMKKSLAGYSGASALWGAMFGIPHPMMPLVLGARKWRNLADGVLLSWGYQTVALFGSKKSVPVLNVDVQPTSGGAIHRTVPGFGTGDMVPINPDGTWRRKTIFTWENVNGIEKAAPFLGDADTPMHLAFGRWVEHSAGDMNLITSGFDFSDGTAKNVFGIFVNNHRPPGLLTTNLPAWQGAVQSIVLPLDGMTLSNFEGVTQDILYKTDDTVSDPLGCVDLRDWRRVTRISAGERISLRVPVSGPNLGDMRAVRVCFLINQTDSTADFLWMNGRHSNITPMLVASAVYSNDHSVDWQSSPGLFGSQRLALAGGEVAGSFIVSNWFRFDTWQERPRFLTLAPGAFSAFASPWNFTGRGIAPGTSQLLVYQGDVVFWVDASETGKHVDIQAAWLEVNYVSKLNDGVDTTAGGRVVTGAVTNVPIRGAHHRGPLVKNVGSKVLVSNLQDRPKDDEPNGRLWVTGRGPFDDSDGTFTGGDEESVIEHPADIAGAIIRHYAGLSSFTNRAVGSEFGSMIAARTALAGVHHTMIIDSGSILADVMADIGANSMSFIQEQLDDVGARQFRMFVDGEDPETNQPERMYRGDGYGFTWDKIRPGSFDAVSTDSRTLSSDIKIRFGWIPQTKKWYGTMYVDDVRHSFRTDGAAYVTACVNSRNAYKFSTPFTHDLPHVFDDRAVEVITKYYCDALRERRVIVEFETYANGLDLQAGHIIKFADALATTGEKKAWPGLGSSSWSAHQFTVIETSQSKDSPEPFLVRVRAIETITAAA